MTTELAATQKFESPIDRGEVRAALFKAASRFGKPFENKDGQMVVRPKSAIHRMVISYEVEQNRSGGYVVTFSGRIGVGFWLGTMTAILMALSVFTIIGIVILIFTLNWSRKIVRKTFDDVVQNTRDVLS